MFGAAKRTRRADFTKHTFAGLARGTASATPFSMQTNDKDLHSAYVTLSHVRSIIATVARRLSVQGMSPEVMAELRALLVAEENAKSRFTELASHKES